MTSPIVRATFLGGDLGPKDYEEKTDRALFANIEEAHNDYPDMELIVTESFLPRSVVRAHTSLRHIQIHKYGNKKEAAIRGVSKVDYDSLISQSVDRFFVKKGDAIASSTKSMKGAVRKVKTKFYVVELYIV